MSRFDTLFADLKVKNEGAFVPFVTLCDPDFDRSFEIIETLIANGADALELGFPFSDPLLDGPVIQAANKRALDGGYSTDACFEMIAKIRSKYPEIPIGLLLCANLVFVPTEEVFFKRCAETGVDAVLIADVPVLAAEEFTQTAKKYGIQSVFICPPNADQVTIERIARLTEGYTYLVSRAGVTSAENQAHAKNLDNLIECLKRSNSAPILQGFGIAKPEQVKEALALGCDGAISGSAIVKIIESHLDNQTCLLAELADFVTTMKNATYRA
ncbi:tryptophan synthase subunit alpha [Actinobacillus equuli]|uniref:Tryptophan synthase alpha chain n=1 Tax=Actinobacillus equuli TaxID=718 RepID=A0AAX3FN10_ACTEU|nr:tryptophan synthase subunit alpha [Actinobacillus equuli]AIZ78716.1 tryptophan synthase subunit alpha [Actinobacillus equuli subsp. equuli]WGE44973.1 tryptophan synthase subunit alpha [Actinobacillus equuli subsp. equuli]VEE92912.1 tryptophan synthase subunit alpha [Actinobacillus equuli]